MNRIIELLEAAGVEYRREAYGNPYYYNDGFQVPALVVRFDYDLTASGEEYRALEGKERDFVQYIKRRKGYCVAYSGRCGIRCPWYAVMSVFDHMRQHEHEARICADVEKFWQEEHARREAAKLGAVI